MRRKSEIRMPLRFWVAVAIGLAQPEVAWPSCSFPVQETAGTATVSPAAEADDGDRFLIVRDRGLLPVEGPLSLETDGVRWGSRELFRWESILDGKVDPEIQAEFSGRVRTYGIPLGRLLDQLGREDWVAAAESGRQLSLQMAQEPHPVQVLVSLAAYREALANGEREWAVGPWLEMVSNPALGPAGEIAGWSGLLPPTLGQGEIPGELPPVWGDVEQAGRAWESLQPALRAAQRRGRLSVGWFVYGISLASAAGETADAKALWEAWQASGTADPVWSGICGAMLEIAEGQTAGAGAVLKELAGPDGGDRGSGRTVLSPVAAVTRDYWIVVSRYRQNLADSPATAFRELMGFVALRKDEWPEVAQVVLLAAMALAREQNWDWERQVTERELELLRTLPARYNQGLPRPIPGTGSGNG